MATESKTLDDVKYCPKCGNHGKVEGTRGSVKITCMNERCPWYETPWIVEVKDDGRVWEGDRETSD